jgi:hypothetical protein
VGLYAAAFVLLLGSAYTLARGNLESSLRFVWLSMGLSGLALVAAVLSLVLPARSRLEPSRPEPEENPPKQG